jgi:hypothetical protein
MRSESAVAGDVTLAQLRDAFADQLPEISPAVTRRIRAEVASYAEVPFHEHCRDVHHQLLDVVNGLRSRTPPSRHVIQHVHDVGLRRAAAGLPLPDVIEAYHIGYREIWSHLLEQAEVSGDRLASALTGEVGLLLHWFHQFSATVAEAHISERSARQATLLDLRRQLLDQLTGRHNYDDAVARSLGFDPNGSFAVVVVRSAANGGGLTGDEGALISDAVACLAGVAQCLVDRDRLVLVTQGMDPLEVSRAALTVLPSTFVGVGLSRSGLAGAAESKIDSDQALERARTGQPIAEFRDEWPLATLLSMHRRLEPVLAPGTEVARRHPHLADAVRAYASAKYTLSGCARALNIHPNSARYRLDRWRELTGWDVETFTGLLRSMACLDLAERVEATAVI